MGTGGAAVPLVNNGVVFVVLLQGHEDEKGHKQLFSLYGAMVHGHFTKVGPHETS